MNLVRDAFIERMERELSENQCKGDWNKWRPTMCKAIEELNHHFVKLVYALAQKDKNAVSSHAADVATNAMKIDELFGA